VGLVVGRQGPVRSVGFTGYGWLRLVLVGGRGSWWAIRALGLAKAEEGGSHAVSRRGHWPGFGWFSLSAPAYAKRAWTLASRFLQRVTLNASRKSWCYRAPLPVACTVASWTSMRTTKSSHAFRCQGKKMQKKEKEKKVREERKRQKKE
jgi:hypothetical protein